MLKAIDIFSKKNLYIHINKKVLFCRRHWLKTRKSLSRLVDVIAFRLVRNGRYEAVYHKLPLLVSQEVSDLWKATAPDPVNIFRIFLTERIH